MASPPPPPGALPQGNLSDLSAGDWVVISGSLLAMFAVAGFSTWRTRNASTASSYFLAGRNMPWWICAASLFASNVGTEHFVGQAGSAAASGIAVAMYEWTAGYLLILLGWIFAPIYLRNHLSTIPEFLERRFNSRTRALLVFITLIAYAMTKLGASLYAGAIIMEVLTGVSMWVSAPAVILLTCLYTAAGGLTAVMLTDTVQLAIFVVGGLVGAGISLNLVGGQSGLWDSMDTAGLGYFRDLIRPANDAEYPWPGMFFGLPVGALWYWCIDQEMAQRVLSVHDAPEAKLGCGVAGFMKILPPFITVFPGIVARSLFEQCNASGRTQFTRWCDTAMDDEQQANKAYPLLVLYEFPHLVKGLMVAAFLAAMMSSLAAIFNSAATIFSYDVYQRFRYPGGRAPASEMLWVGRAVTVVMTVFSLAYLPIIAGQQDTGMYIAVQSGSMHLAPAIVTVFVLGIFWRRANGAGAFWGLLIGSLFGLVRFTVSLAYETECSDARVTTATGESLNYTAGNWFQCLSFTYFALVLTGFTVVIMVAVSYATPPPPAEKTDGRLVAWWAKLTGQEGAASASAMTSNPTYDVQMAQLPKDKPEGHWSDSTIGAIEDGKGKRGPKKLLPADKARSDAPVSGMTDRPSSPSKAARPASRSGSSEEEPWQLPEGGEWIYAHREIVANVLAVSLVIALSILLGYYW